MGNRVLRGGDHPPAATPRIAMETAAAARSKFPGGSAPGAPPGTLQPPPPPRSCRERGAIPETTLPGLGRRWAEAQLGGSSAGKSHSGAFSALGTGVKDGRGVVLSWAASNGGGTSAANPLSSPPPCRGDRGERMEMRGGRTRGRQMPAQSWSLFSAAALLCPPGSFARPGHRLPHLPGHPVPAPGPADAPSAAGPAALARSPLPRDGAASSFSGKTRAVSPLAPTA